MRAKVGATSLDQLLALVQRRGSARKALKLFLHQATVLARDGHAQTASSAVLLLLNAVIECRHSEWTQALTEERDTKRQRVNSSKNDVVFAAKMAQSLVKVYASTNGAAVTEEELEDLKDAMDLACVALYVVCALEHSVRLGDVVVDNLLYQVAKKYAEIPKVGVILVDVAGWLIEISFVEQMQEAAWSMITCVHFRLWNVHSKLCDGSSAKSNLMQLLSHRKQDSVTLASKVVQNAELVAEFPKPRSFHTTQFARLVLGLTNTCVSLLSGVKKHKVRVVLALTIWSLFGLTLMWNV
ncbi:Separin [Phytophthora megakarya]|uniref:Separin n=1 Tax=Phytophthora megakarya TaxID=4795 RepID=A0A225X3G0_9STRA|nr:Separin [Phytophthora megakarya]